MHELVEMEVRELLTHYDFPGDKTVFIKGSALCALNGTEPELGKNSIKALLDAMDTYFEDPKREKDKDFLMSIEGSLNIAGRGCVTTGTVEQGKCKINDEVQLIGFRRKPTPCVITGIETFHKQLPHAEAGDNVGVLLRGVLKEQVRRGMTLIKPNSVDVRRNCNAEIYVLKPEEGGRSKPFHTGYRPQAFIRTADVAADITLPPNVQMALPGDNLNITMKLNFPLPIVVG
jgi:elongation factor Tu